MTPAPTPAAEEIERIVGKLTKAQRRAISEATYADARGVWHPAGWYARGDRRVRYNLARAKLTPDYLRPANRLTPLGLAVRDRIMGGER